MKTYVIEHRTRGVLIDIDFDWDRGSYSKPRFSYNKSRSEGKAYYSVDAAKRDFAKLPEGIRAKSYIWGPLGLKGQVVS